MSRDNFSENLGDLLEKEKQEVAFFVELQKKKKKKKTYGLSVPTYTDAPDFTMILAKK